MKKILYVGQIAIEVHHVRMFKTEPDFSLILVIMFMVLVSAQRIRMIKQIIPILLNIFI